MARISFDDWLPLALRACPSFRPEWMRYVASPYFQPAHTVDHFLEFGRHLARLAARGDVVEFHDSFQLIDEFRVHGDDLLFPIAESSLLEAVQEVAEELNVDLKVFESYLSPPLVNWWSELLAYRRSHRTGA